MAYPVTAPVGIVSIGNENNDKLLLIRQPRYPKGMYSCIAGFLDAGEAIEVLDPDLCVRLMCFMIFCRIASEEKWQRR